MVSTVEAGTVTSAPPYPAHLAVYGPAWQSRLSRDGQILLSKPEVQIGLLGSNDVVLSDPLASRLHAVIRWAPNGYVIQDAGSMGGTTVEGHRIAEPVLLVPGQRIQIGNTILQFEVLAPQVGAAASPPFAATSSVDTRFRAWLQRQKGKYYWRVFLAGLIGYIAATITLNSTNNGHIVPLVLLIGSSVVPVAFVIFCWEEGAFADIPATVVGLAFVSGMILGLVLAAVLEPILVIGTGFLSALMVGLCEETAKGAAASWFLRDKRLNSELDGLIIGAAAGMGFAALETAGYGFSLFLDGFTNAIGHATGSISVHDAFVSGLDSMEHVLALRMALAAFGHGTWTAIICAALWRDRGTSLYRLTPGVVVAFAISVLLHALWDTNIALLPISAVLGVLVLRFFIKESVERSRLGPMAPPPRPLTRALGDYFLHIFHLGRHLVGQPPALTAALSTAAPVPAASPVMAPGPLPSTPTAPMPASAPAVSTMIQCPRCSAMNAAGYRFCSKCGNQLSS